MKINSLLISILLNSPLAAQNLVPNPSFEEHFNVQCGLVSGKKEVAHMIPPWTMPTRGTPDVFSYNVASQGCLSHPLSTDINAMGQMEPKDGSAMVGLYTHFHCPVCLDHESTKESFDYKEYLHIPLLRSLQPGERYLAGMWVSHANRVIYASNNIGMAFSTKPVDTEEVTTIYLPAKVNEEKVLANAGEWKRVFGVFTADSAYTHLLLGNFFYAADTKIREFHFEEYNPRVFAYYFIDSVFVEPFPKLDIPNVITPNGDGFNDAFVIDNLSTGFWTLSIYNRYGNQVYYSPAYTNDWDGDGLSPGVYYYSLQHTFIEESYKGWIHLIR
jgi:gliding motility-associated-like protein